MSPITYNPLSLFISLAAITGVFNHSMQIDNAARLAVLSPSVVSDHYASIVNLSRADQHAQSEVGSFSVATHNIGSEPSTQPKNDDKKYVIQKRMLGNGFDSDYLWPSS